jgi:hypothetical protein
MDQPNRRGNSFHKAADDYAAQGFSVLPCGRDKRPLLPTWAEFQKRPPTAAELDGWAKADPDANVALVCGRLADLTVVDCDTAEAIAAVEALIPDTLAVPVTTTPRGGRHYHFKFTPGLVSRTTAENIDVKTEGGYVVDAGRTDKGVYARNGIPIADRPAMPGALLAFLKEHQAAPGTTARGPLLTLGTRDEDMFHLAWSLVRDGRSPEEVERICLAVGKVASPPFPERETRAKIKSAWERMRRNDATAGGAAPERKEFKTFTTREMFEKYGVDEPRWLVEGWLPEASCGLVVAPPGGHKTWILLNLAFAVSTGRPFLGSLPIIGKGPVLFIQQEDPFQMSMSRIARMFDHVAPPDEKPRGNTTHELDCGFTEEMLNMPIHWHEARELNLEDRGSVNAVEAKIAELRPRLTIIDPLYSAVSAKDYMAEGAQKMLLLKKLRDKYGTSFAIGHHTTVAGGTSEDRATIWGSQFLNAWLEWGWRLVGTDDADAVKVIRHFKGSETPKKLLLRFKITNWGFGVEIDERVTESTVSKIEEAILAGGRFRTERALAKAVDCSPFTAHKAVTRLGLRKDDEGYFKK